MTLLLAFTLEALGYCYGAPMVMLPAPGSTVPDRPEIAISWGEESLSQPWPESVMELGPSLVSERGTRVPLVRMGDLRTAHDHQLILRTEGRLPQGTWRLDFEEAPTPSWARKATWESTGRPDTQAPVWRGAMEVEAAWVAPQICGEMANIQLRVPVRDPGPLTLEVELVPAREEGKLQRFRVPVKDGVANLATGYCTGTFKLTPGDHWLSVSAVDAAGNTSRADDMPHPLRISDGPK